MGKLSIEETLCPCCGEQLRLTGSLCSYCGTNFKEKELFCPFCGEQLRLTESSCVNCGMSFEEMDGEIAVIVRQRKIQEQKVEGVSDMLEDNKENISIKELLVSAYDSEKAWEDASRDCRLCKEAKAQGVQINGQDVTSEMVRQARASKRIKANKWNEDVELLGKNLRIVVKKYGKKKFKNYASMKTLVSEILRMKDILKKQISE